jgi:hypothetical protein
MPNPRFLPGSSDGAELEGVVISDADSARENLPRNSVIPNLRVLALDGGASDDGEGGVLALVSVLLMVAAMAVDVVVTLVVLG